jgi:dihydroorotate dehydrogenase
LELSNKVIRSLYHVLANEIPIIGAGGILSPEDAKSKMQSGAQLVQLYTGLIYQGPSLVSECAEAIAMSH